MATYFSSSSGSNTAPYDTWAKAATTLATALAAATADGDIVVQQYNAIASSEMELAADTSFTMAAAIRLVSASNDGGSAYTPTLMGESNWIGNSTTNRTVNVVPPSSKKVVIEGFTLRTAGTVSDSIQLHAVGAVGEMELVSCRLWTGNTSTSSRLSIGSTTAGQVSTTIFRNCIYRFGSTSQGIALKGGARMVDFGGVIDTNGSVPSTFLQFTTNAGCTAEFIGSDLSALAGSSTFVGDASNTFPAVVCRGVTFGSGVTILATQTTTSRDTASVRLNACRIGSADVSGFYNSYGSMTSDTSVYRTGTAGAASWKVVTTANCSALTPFYTPWLDKYNTGTSAVSLGLEVLRNDTTTAFTDAQAWVETMIRETASSIKPTFRNDRCVTGATPANQTTGVGTGSWTGVGGSAWSGRFSVGSVTPATVGPLAMRCGAAVASATFYVDTDFLAA